MLKPVGKRESLAGKLLLSSALVAVSLAYGWWQRTDAENPRTAMAPAPLPVAPKSSAPIPPFPAITPPDPAEQAQAAASDDGVASGTKEHPDRPAAEPQKTPAVVTAPVRAIVPPAAPEPSQSQNGDASSSPVASAAPAQIAARADDASSLFLVTGTPDPAAKSPAPAGTHLEDGDYVSGRHQFMWGDLRIKILVRGGAITGVQALQFPDHRSQSLYLSGLSLPKLESEVIKKQTAQVDTVSSATDTSIVFQDAVADAIVKATRG
jgi:uncharacterized protein with FMN-binding domain